MAQRLPNQIISWLCYLASNKKVAIGTSWLFCPSSSLRWSKTWRQWQCQVWAKTKHFAMRNFEDLMSMEYNWDIIWLKWLWSLSHPLNFTMGYYWDTGSVPCTTLRKAPKQAQISSWTCASCQIEQKDWYLITNELTERRWLKHCHCLAASHVKSPKRKCAVSCGFKWVHDMSQGLETASEKKPLPAGFLEYPPWAATSRSSSWKKKEKKKHPFIHVYWLDLPLKICYHLLWSKYKTIATSVPRSPLWSLAAFECLWLLAAAPAAFSVLQHGRVQAKLRALASCRKAIKSSSSSCCRRSARAADWPWQKCETLNCHLV